MADQGVLDVPFVGLVAKTQKIEVVGIFQNLLGKLDLATFRVTDVNGAVLDDIGVPLVENGQTADVHVDLAHHGQVPAPGPDGDLVDADGHDAVEVAVLKPPQHHVLDGSFLFMPVWWRAF